MTVDSYDDKCPRWLRNGQVPPAALWAEHFNRNAKKRNVIYTKYLEQRLAACRAKYGFLNPEQVFGMALAELRVPTCGFKINQKFLNSHKANRRQSKGDSKGNEKSRSYCLFEDSEPSLEEVTVDKWSFPSSNKKNRRQSKGNSKPGNKNSRSYCLFEDAEPSSDEISTNDFHHRNQIYEFPSSPTRFVQNDDIFGDLSEMFEEVQIQPFKSLTRKTRPSDVSSSTKRKNIKSPKDNQLLNQFEKFKEMVNCDGEITSHETRNESAKKSSVILPVPVVNAVAKNVNKSILKNNKSKGNVSKTSIHEKSVQFNENLEEVREYLAFEDNDDSSTIEYNSPLDSSLNISFQEASKTMSESSLLDESSITNVEEIVASTPLPVEEESVMEIVGTEENEIVENGSTYTSPTIQSIENKDIEEGTTCGSPLFETSQTEDCETVSQKSESSDGSIIYNSFVDSYKCTIPLKNKSNEKLLNESREAISIENNISSMKSNTICYEQDMQDIEHSSPIQVICEKEVQESHLSDDSDCENYSLNNSVQSDSDEGIEATNVIFNYVEMNEEDRRDIKLRQKYATSQNSDTSDSIAVNLEVNIDVDSEAEKIVDSEAENVADSVAETESQNEDTSIRSEKIDSSELNITNQNNLANNIDESIENYESFEDSSSSSKSELRDENGEVETPKVTLQINKQNSCVDGLKQYTNSQYSNKSPETGIIASSRMEMVSKQNEELPMVQKFANIDLDILNQNNLSETIGDTEINRSMIASTRAISLEDVAKDQQYDKFESVSQSENELFRKKRLHFVSVSVPICPADVIGDVELPQNEQFEMTSKDNQRTDLGTTYRNNLSKIHKDTEMNMRALTPTTAHSNEEYVTGDQNNKNVESLCLLENEIKRKERSYFESLKVPIRPTDETEDFSTMERLSEEIGGDNIIDYKSQSDSNSLDNITVEKKISKNYYESTKISIAPKLIESSNLNQESNVLYLQSKTLPFELNKQIKSKQPSHLQSPTIVIHPKKRVNSDSKIRSPKESIHLTKGQISHLESNRIPFLNRNEDKNSSEGHISSQLLDMETQTLNDLNSNSSSDSSVQLVSAASNKSAKKRNFSSIFGNSLGKYLPGMYPGNAVSPSSIDERPCTNYDLSLDEIINIEDDDKESYLKLNDSFFDEKSSPFHKIPSFEDDFQLIQSDDSLAEFCAALRKPKDWRSKLYSQLKSDDESLASSLEFADPKRRRRNADSKKYLEPTTKENIMTSQTTNVTETTSIAEMRKLICTDWLAHNEFFKTNTDNWLTTSNTPITDFNIRIPDDTTRVIPMDDGGEEDSHQLPDIEFLSSEY